MQTLLDDDGGPIGGQPTGFREEALRQSVLMEIHARPFQGIATPRRIFHYAFLTDGDGAKKARDQLRERCRGVGLAEPALDANHFIVTIGKARLRWETHSEFTTYTWDMAPDLAADPPPFSELLAGPFDQPGPLIVATRLDLIADHRETGELLEGLDPGTTAVSALREGRAIGATDFRLHKDGMTHILLVDRGLYAHEIGPMVIRLTELETYRTLALLGLPEARRLQPLLGRAEAGLHDATTKIGLSPDLAENRALLESLTKLAGDLEASASRSAYRFGATKAYYEIVQNRMTAIREQPLEGYTRWSSYLQRRMAPAMRTCIGVEARQREISERLARAANLLRTRIEVDLEQQNRELLASMNRRARLQLRLQQWVEGLSVAAVSYYVVGLVSYLAHGAESLDAAIEPSLITALAVLPVVIGIWLFVRIIRARSHAEEAEEEQLGP
jgi:uncharacterized membrane-anchored protein